MISPELSNLLGLTPAQPTVSIDPLTGKPRVASPVNAKLACFFAAQGEPLEAIAKKLGTTLELVEAAVNSPQGTELVIRLQTALFPDIRQRIQRAAHSAMDVKLRILNTSSNEALRDKVATDILDRTLGKATQVTENRNMNFDVKDHEALTRQLAAGRERLDKIESMKRALELSKPRTIS